MLSIVGVARRSGRASLARDRARDGRATSGEPPALYPAYLFISVFVLIVTVFGVMSPSTQRIYVHSQEARSVTVIKAIFLLFLNSNAEISQPRAARLSSSKAARGREEAASSSEEAWLPYSFHLCAASLRARQ